MSCAICGKDAKHIFWETHWLCGDHNGKTGCAKRWYASNENAIASKSANADLRGKWTDAHGAGYAFYEAFVPQLRAFVTKENSR